MMTAAGRVSEVALTYNGNLTKCLFPSYVMNVNVSEETCSCNKSYTCSRLATL